MALLSIVAGTAAAYGYAQTRPEVYESSTSVLVEPAMTQDPTATGGRARGELNLDTEAQLVASTPVATGAARLMGSRTPPDELAAGVTVAVPANTSVLVVTYAAGSPQAARTASHAFAEAYLRNRQETATAELTNEMTVVGGKLKELNNSLVRVNQQLTGMRSDSPSRANLISGRDTLQSQLNALNTRMDQLATTTVQPGRIIRDATLPRRPHGPDLRVDLAVGAACGLLLGLALAVARERLDRRVRHGADLRRRTGVAVLATVPADLKPSLDGILPPFGAGGRIFHRLRNEVLASLPVRDCRVIAVTGPSRGAAATVVAANLAAAFARTGSETVLISAQLPDSIGDAAPVTALFGVAPAPGLSDVLSGRATLADAAQRTPRTPGLRVVTTGATASAGGLLQSQSLRDTLAALRHQAEYVVIEAPSTASSADAQSLASLADAAILAVEARRTRYVQITDAADQLRRVGTPVLGAVVLSRLGRPAPHARPADAVLAAGVPAEATAGDGTRPDPVGGPDLSLPDTPTLIFRRIEDDDDLYAGLADAADLDIVDDHDAHDDSRPSVGVAHRAPRRFDPTP
ncbi:lipopolysaccharide biosynthesis protein [Planosporangium sp. 12N6]|uniref:polysaccharide biosynthesis tyrosine autokinase n=1 Tax=Planosporangium spinosum TaxID=3402278 RepID=UPI003CF70964